MLRDHLIEEGYKQEEIGECVDTFMLNAKFLGLLRSVSGAERLLPVEHILEELAATPQSRPTDGVLGVAVSATPDSPSSASAADWQRTCFYITPIGDDQSEHRRHSDLFLNSIVAPALEELGLTVVRADHIGKPGMITAQVIEHVLRAKLVVADLSFHNPNVFYELSLRHACKLPTVQIIRAADPIPFDLDQFRTVVIDTTDIYSLVPALDIYKAEVATHARRALEGSDAADNPLTVFCPGLTVTMPVFASPG